MDVLEIYLNEVERQLDRKVKVIAFDKGGEYYGRYDKIGQHPGPFAKLLHFSKSFCSKLFLSRKVL